MRLLYLSLFVSYAVAFGAPPAQDSRNINIPHTDTHFRMPVYNSKAEWSVRSTQLRKQILWAAGLDPMPKKTALNPRYVGRIERPGYTIDRVALETFPGYYLGGNLFRPSGKTGKLPAVASPHGHWKHGRLEHEELGSIPARAVNLARQGYVVFTYDMVGYNDTDQTIHRFGDNRQMLWSFGPLGLQLWNSIRVIDFLESLAEVDRDRISATGASGGGTQTFLLTAVDDRLKAAAPVNMISAIMQGGCVCENAPGLRFGTSNLEFAAMAAPRPLLMVSATGDWTRNTPKEEYPAVRGIYELLGKPDLVESVQIDAKHNYNQASREAMYRFFAKHVLGTADSPAEQPIDIDDMNSLLVWQGKTKPDNAISSTQLFDYWMLEASRQNAEASQADRIDRLRRALAADIPADVQVERTGERIVLYRPAKGDRIPGILIGSGKITTLVVHDQGAAAARAHAAVQDALTKRESVLLIDAFQTGEAQVARDLTKVKHFLTFNKSDDAERVQDILNAVSYARTTGARSVNVVGLGKGAIWSAFAAAVAPPGWITLTEKPAAFSGSDEELQQQFFVPGVQRAGGWATVQKTVKWKN